MSSPQMRVKRKKRDVGDPWEIGKTLSSEPLVHVLNTLSIYRLEGGLNVSVLVRRHGVSNLARRYRVFPPSHGITSFLQRPAPVLLDIPPIIHHILHRIHQGTRTADTNDSDLKVNSSKGCPEEA
eukprot:12692664-Ditylum_brightwellii.AAC.1